MTYSKFLKPIRKEKALIAAEAQMLKGNRSRTLAYVTQTASDKEVIPEARTPIMGDAATQALMQMAQVQATIQQPFCEVL